MRGRAWAYLGAVLGGSVSVAANIAHCYIPPKGAPSGWTPQTGAVALSALWPVMVLVAVEILGRVAWPAGWRWWVLRWGGLTPVTAVAAVVSYRHLSGLLASYGEDAVVAVIGPLAIDGLMVISSAALLSLSGQAACPDTVSRLCVSGHDADRLSGQDVRARGQGGVMSADTDRLPGQDVRGHGHPDTVSVAADRRGQPVASSPRPESVERLSASVPVRLPDADTACPDMSGLRDPHPQPWRTSWADTPPVSCGDACPDTDSTPASSTSDTGRVTDTMSGHDVPLSASADRPGQVSATADSGRGQARTGSVRDRTWALHTRYPDMPVAEIARQLDVTERTIRRHLSTCPDTVSALADTPPALADTSV